jgi:hypothetical protein
VHWHFRARSQVDTFEILAGEDRRIHEVVVADRLEPDRIAIPRGHLEGTAELPAVGQLHAGLGHDATAVIARRIDRVRVPLQIEHFRGHHHPALGPVLRREVLKRHFEAADALRHVGGVHFDCQRAVIGHILRRQHVSQCGKTAQSDGRGNEGGRKTSDFQGILQWMGRWSTNRPRLRLPLSEQASET